MKPDEVIHLSMGQCPHCNHDLGEPIKTETIQTPQENKSKNGNHDLGEPIKTETKIIEDLPPPRKIKVTQFDTDVYRCPNCGAEVRGKHEDCPQNSWCLSAGLPC
jgi:hypothetical protein